MKTSCSLTCSFLAVFLATISTTLAADVPQEEDPCATNWFGVTRSAPIETGFLVVDGKYVSPPYTVEQRGYVIFVNDEAVDLGASPRLVFPGEEFEPVNADPGRPTGITEQTSVHDLARHPVTIRKERYWATIGGHPNEWAQRLVEYYQSFPCIQKIEEVETGHTGRRFEIRDRSGRVMSTGWGPGGPEPLPEPPTKEYLLTNFIMPTMRSLEANLQANMLLVVQGKSVKRLISSGAESWNVLAEVITNAPWPDELRLRLGKITPYWSGSEHQEEQ